MIPSRPADSEYTALLLLSQGVTAASLLGGTSAAETHALRERIDRGDIPGPRLFPCEPILDGPNPVLPSSEVIVDAEQARRVVGRLATSRRLRSWSACRSAGSPESSP